VKRKLTRISAIVAIGLLLFVSTGGTAGAVKSPPSRTYLALGDSYSSGEGNPGSILNPWLNQSGAKEGLLDDGCHRSAAAYPTAVSGWLRKQSALPAMSLHFTACSGADTEDLWNSGATGVGLMSASGDHGEAQQLLDTPDFAAARVVTITMGGNDLNFRDVLTNCTDFALHSCDASSNDPWIANLGKNISDLKPILVNTYRQIEQEAPGAALYVVGFPDLFPPDPALPLRSLLACSFSTKTPIGAIPTTGVQYLISNEIALSAVVHDAALQAGAHFVDPNSGPNTFAGHDVCAAKSTSWINRPNVNALPLVGTEAYSYHPNKKGQTALAATVEAAVSADSTPSYSPEPRLTNVTAIASGSDSNCALIAGGSVDCWGDLYFGPPSTYADTLVPMQVTGLSGVTQVSVGDSHACALLADETVKCWGDNTYGELGNGTTVGSLPPVGVTGLTGVVHISAGYQHTCALLRSGVIECWGGNSYGQLGDGSNTNSSVPVSVSGITNATSVSAAMGWQSCALLAGGTMDCWGYNGDGELGNGTEVDSDVPVKVSGLNGVAALAPGSYYTCARVVGGSADCWGAPGDAGAGAFLGGTHVNVNYDFPAPVKSFGYITGLSANLSATCALVQTGTVFCSGYNGYGQLGNGSFTDSSDPVQVSGIDHVSSVSVGQSDACALLTSGTVDCWGYAEGLGNGATANANHPVAVIAAV
jgi:alpha-tubulin suppressor-like RCC1 family protein